MIDCQPVNVCTWMDVNVNPGFINPWAVELGETQTVMILKMIPLNYRRVDITCSSHFLEGFSELKCKVWLANRHEAAMFPPHDRNSGALQSSHCYMGCSDSLNRMTLLVHQETYTVSVYLKIVECQYEGCSRYSSQSRKTIGLSHTLFSDEHIYCLQALPWMFFLSPYDSDNSSNFLWIFMEIGTANWRVVSELSWLLQ